MQADRPYIFRPLECCESSQLENFLYLAVHVPPGCPQPDSAIVRDPLMACYIKDWGRSQDFGMVAQTRQSKVVGIAWVRQLTRACPGYGFVDEATLSLAISILPSFRGQGIGTELLTELLEQVPCDKISLSVQNSNPAKRLYRRIGFVTVRESVDESVMIWTRARTQG